MSYIHARFEEKFESLIKAQQRLELLISIVKSLEKSHHIFVRRFPYMDTVREFDSNTHEYFVGTRISIGERL